MISYRLKIKFLIHRTFFFETKFFIHHTCSNFTITQFKPINNFYINVTLLCTNIGIMITQENLTFFVVSFFVYSQVTRHHSRRSSFTLGSLSLFLITNFKWYYIQHYLYLFDKKIILYPSLFVSFYIFCALICIILKRGLGTYALILKFWWILCPNLIGFGVYRLCILSLSLYVCVVEVFKI